MHLIKDRGFMPRRGETITPERVYAQRRALLMQTAALAAAWGARPALAQSAGPGKLPPLPGGKSAVSGALTMEKPTLNYTTAPSGSSVPSPRGTGQ